MLKRLKSQFYTDAFQKQGSDHSKFFQTTYFIFLIVQGFLKKPDLFILEWIWFAVLGSFVTAFVAMFVVLSKLIFNNLITKDDIEAASRPPKILILVLIFDIIGVYLLWKFVDFSLINLPSFGYFGIFD
ncbi:MAG: hypothetical protein ACJ0G5_06760 [Alphaproteobacteria bacterium]